MSILRGNFYPEDRSVILLNGKLDNNHGLVVWRMTDGRPGHDNQSKGLINAMQRLTECVSFEIACPPANRLFLPFLTKHFPPADSLPDPDLIIGAGHGTHFSMLTAQRARGGMTIVIMRPSLPIGWFDFCLIPSHDRCPGKQHVIVTEGALNQIVPAAGHDQTSGLILIGGPSRHYNWNNDALIKQIKAILARADCSWILADSPRTPQNTRISLEMLAGKGVEYFPYHRSESGWLPSQLQAAGTVWVTEDSISMIYEAITSGSAVGLLHTPVRKPGRITRSITNLMDSGRITGFEAWASGKALVRAIPPLFEADRCARLLLQRLNK